MSIYKPTMLKSFLVVISKKRKFLRVLETLYINRHQKDMYLYYIYFIPSLSYLSNIYTWPTFDKSSVPTALALSSTKVILDLGWKIVT